MKRILPFSLMASCTKEGIQPQGKQSPRGLDFDPAEDTLCIGLEDWTETQDSNTLTQPDSEAYWWWYHHLYGYEIGSVWGE